MTSPDSTRSEYLVGAGITSNYLELRVAPHPDWTPGCASAGSVPDPTTARRKPWAWLLHYVFLTDVSQCSRCGDRMQWVETATSAEALNRSLADHDLADSDLTPPVASSPQHAQDLPPEQLRFCFAPHNITLRHSRACCSTFVVHAPHLRAPFGCELCN